MANAGQNLMTLGHMLVGLEGGRRGDGGARAVGGRGRGGGGLPAAIIAGQDTVGVKLYPPSSNLPKYRHPFHQA